MFDLFYWVWWHFLMRSQNENILICFVFRFIRFYDEVTNIGCLFLILFISLLFFWRPLSFKMASFISGCYVVVFIVAVCVCVCADIKWRHKLNDFILCFAWDGQFLLKNTNINANVNAKDFTGFVCKEKYLVKNLWHLANDRCTVKAP